MEKNITRDRDNRDRGRDRDKDRDKDREVIYGRNAVKEALTAGNIPIEKFYIPESGVDPALAALRRLAEQKGIVCKSADKRKLDSMTGGGNHQGAVLRISARSYMDFEELLKIPTKKKELPLFLSCFQIQDPHNLGSLLRTCDCAGVHGVVIPKNHSVGLTSVVSKVASGADAYVPVSKVSAIYDSTLEMKSRGIKIYGLCPYEGKSYRDVDYNVPLCILLGAEGRGLDRRLLSVCDEHVKIPLMGTIDSLNAGVAGALVLYEAMWSRKNR